MSILKCVVKKNSLAFLNDRNFEYIDFPATARRAIGEASSEFVMTQDFSFKIEDVEDGILIDQHILMVKLPPNDVAPYIVFGSDQNVHVHYSDNSNAIYTVQKFRRLRRLNV